MDSSDLVDEIISKTFCKILIRWRSRKDYVILTMQELVNSDGWVLSVGLHYMVWRVHLHQVWQRVLNQSCSEITLCGSLQRNLARTLLSGELRWASSPVKRAGPMRSSGKKVREYIIWAYSFLSVRVHHKKERLGESSPWEKERWGESSPWEMGSHLCQVWLCC